MNPYLAAALVGVAIAGVICGIQCLGIWLASRARRRAQRAQWERERPYREAIRAHEEAQTARHHLHQIEQLRQQGLLNDASAAELSELATRRQS
jgi:type VI protein secretion system component VasK